MVQAMQDSDTDIRTASTINFLLGVWLIITPYWFGYTSSAARWDQTIIGIVVLVLAGVRAVAPNLRWTSFITGLAGIWAVIAPFILGYNRSAAYWNEIIVGVIVALLAFYNSSLSAGGQTHHHTHA